MIKTWIREVSANDRTERVLRLTDAKSVIPTDAFISGNAPDPHSPPLGKQPIEITWSNSRTTKHFVREDSNRFMITDRTEVVQEFYDANPNTSRIAITYMGERKFIISPVEN